MGCFERCADPAGCHELVARSLELVGEVSIELIEWCRWPEARDRAVPPFGICPLKGALSHHAQGGRRDDPADQDGIGLCRLQVSSIRPRAASVFVQIQASRGQFGPEGGHRFPPALAPAEKATHGRRLWQRALRHARLSGGILLARRGPHRTPRPTPCPAGPSRLRGVGHAPARGTRGAVPPERRRPGVRGGRRRRHRDALGCAGAGLRGVPHSELRRLRPSQADGARRGPGVRWAVSDYSASPGGYSGCQLVLPARVSAEDLFVLALGKNTLCCKAGFPLQASTSTDPQAVAQVRGWQSRILCRPVVQVEPAFRETGALLAF